LCTLVNKRLRCCQTIPYNGNYLFYTTFERKTTQSATTRLYLCYWSYTQAHRYHFNHHAP